MTDEDFQRQVIARLDAIGETLSGSRYHNTVDRFLQERGDPLTVAYVKLNPDCRAIFNTTDGWKCDCEHKHPLVCSKAAGMGSPLP